MSGKMIYRGSEVKRAVIASSTAESGAFPAHYHAGAILTMPAAWTAASIGFKVCDTPGGTFAKLYDDDGNLVQIDSPAAGNAYSFPAATYAAHYVKLWSQDGSGNDTNQAAERTIVITTKG